jgi:hypothetical protein
VLNGDTPLYEYEQGTCGPSQLDHEVSPCGGWHNPSAMDEEDFLLAA